MSAPTSPSWYDVLGVDREADAAAIRAAWKEGIADLDPGQPRFRSLNQAAEILLDPKTRQAYDADMDRPQGTNSADPTQAAPTRQKWLRKREPKAERNVAISDVSGKPQREPSAVSLAKAGTSPTAATATLVADPTPELDPDRDPGPDQTRTGPSTWLLLAVAILAAVLVAAAAVLLTQPSDSAIASNTDDAQSAAEQAATTILAYDYRRMDADEKAADALMTPSFAAKYNALFAQLKANAATVKPVVTAQVLASGVVRSGDQRVQILVFVNQSTTRADGEQQVNHNQARFTMVESGGDWLVDDLQTGSQG